MEHRTGLDWPSGEDWGRWLFDSLRPASMRCFAALLVAIAFAVAEIGSAHRETLKPTDGFAAHLGEPVEPNRRRSEGRGPLLQLITSPT